MDFETLAGLEAQLKDFEPVHRHDRFAAAAITEAVCAAKKGNFGIGAVLVNNDTGKVLYRGQNKVFTDFRSDLHAEMDLLNQFENENGAKSRELLKNFTMFSSIEPCPMCLCRIITAGVPEVRHVTEDKPSGMVGRYSKLPPIWREISKDRVFKAAECSNELTEIARKVCSLTIHLDDNLKN